MTIEVNSGSGLGGLDSNSKTSKEKSQILSRKSTHIEQLNKEIRNSGDKFGTTEFGKKKIKPRTGA